MKLSEHVLKSIHDYGDGDIDSALMNACIAIDATARTLYGVETIGKKEYKACIKKYLWIVEPMLGSGINLKESIWHNVEVNDGYGKTITNPDFADVIYHIFRCSHAHGKEVPKNYDLLAPVDGKLLWEVGGGIIRMPTLVVPALLAVSIFSIVNEGIVTVGDEALFLGKQEFIVKDWWGREVDFQQFLSEKIPNPTRVKLGLENMSSQTPIEFSVEITPPSW